MSDDMFSEYLNEMSRRQERQTMHIDANAHQIARLLDRLDEDGLEALSNMLYSIGWGNDAKQLAAMMFGTVQMTRQSRFGRCWVCEKDHDQELKKALGGDDDSNRR